jgi:predicted nucleotidyltransferase
MTKGVTKKIGRTTKKIGGSGWEGLFSSPTLARLLAAFLTHPERAFYQRELIDAAGSGLFTVQRELARLEKAGLVLKTPRGNRAYYQANRNHPAIQDLKRVILKTFGLGDAIRAALAPAADRVRVALVYGSFARGEETTESDIDLLLIGDLTLRDVANLLGPVARQLRREFNPNVYRPEEFRRKAKEGHHFVTEILRGEKVFLIGNEGELEGLAR